MDRSWAAHGHRRLRKPPPLPSPRGKTPNYRIQGLTLSRGPTSHKMTAKKLSAPHAAPPTNDRLGFKGLEMTTCPHNLAPFGPDPISGAPCHRKRLLAICGKIKVGSNTYRSPAVEVARRRFRSPILAALYTYFVRHLRSSKTRLTRPSGEKKNSEVQLSDTTLLPFQS